MVDMNPDLVLEVPDTPDRIARSIEVSSGPSVGRDVVEVELDPLSSHRRINLSRINSARHLGDSGRGNVANSSATPHDTELLFKQAGLARLLSGTLEVKPTSDHGKPLEVRQEGFSNDNGMKLAKKRPFPSSSSIRHKDARGKIRKYSSNEGEGSRDKGGCGNAEFLGAGSVSSSGSQSRANICKEAKTELQNEAQAGLDFVDNKGKGIVYSNDSNFPSKQALSSPIQTFSPQRHVGQRRLVRNGCISPCNIEKGITKSHRDGEQELSSAYVRLNSSFPPISDQDKRNGLYLSKNSQHRTEQTRVMHDGVIISDSIAETRTGRITKEDEVGKRVVEVPPSGEPDEIHNGNPQSEGRHGDNKKGKAILDDNVSSSMPDDKAKFLSNRSNPITMQPLSRSSSQKRSHRPIRGKSKNNGPGESSSSFDDPEISYLGSWKPTNSRSTRTRNTRHQRTVLGAVIEVDEMDYPGDTYFVPQDQSGGISNDSGIRARQVESDEVLARQLQEQFYNESPGVSRTEEIDASIALSLQREEEAQRTSSAARQDQNNVRGAANAHSRTRASSSSNFPSHAQHPTATRMAQVMRGSDWSRMDVLMRLNWFEELEAAFDSYSNMEVPDFLQVQRDFNENDYEMLLALDENNHNHAGASKSQINSLPQSVVQSDNVEECAVCLEKPSIGDTIRHLPCLHKFHKECIDQWLRRKSSCPVCKSGIT
ncbi:uncharacterized protein [Typha angustifolia]|uniref:uncharacterized protein n=1 Tax=Typha angustifolia TaxID=59011 RepID=UPI003C2CA0C1